MIQGVKIKKLTTQVDDRGFFREILRRDDKMLKGVAQTSHTLTFPGVIKAFHWHKNQDDVWYVAQGNAQVVLYDRRKDSPTFKETQVIYMGETNPLVVLIPRGVAHGYKVLGIRAVVLFYHTSCSYNARDPDEKRIPFDDPEIGFDWQTKFR